MTLHQSPDGSQTPLGGFSFLFRLQLNLTDIAVYFALLTVADPEFTCSPSISGLSETLGVGRSTLTRSLTRLRSHGAIQVLRTGRSNTYRLVTSDRTDSPQMSERMCHRYNGLSVAIATLDQRLLDQEQVQEQDQELAMTHQPEKPTNYQQAVDIVKHHWERVEDKPNSFIGLVKIAERTLRAGYTPEQVVDSLDIVAPYYNDVNINATCIKLKRLADVYAVNDMKFDA